MQEIHVSKLPSSKYFTLSDIKQLLPMHQRSSIQNLKIIFNNYSLSTYLKHSVLLADENLTLKPQLSTAYYYSYVKAVWCEDFDDGIDHLKNTLNLAADLANYIGSIDQDSPIQQNEHDVPESNHVSRIQISALTSTGKIQNRPKRYTHIKQEMTAIGFKFEKNNGRIYMIIGVNYKTRESLALACAILRQWNRSRLKVCNNVDGIDIDLLHRICEHLFSMARGFIRDVSDDYNTYHSGLQKFIASIAKLDLSADTTCYQKFKQYKLQPDALPHQAIILKCQVTFRSKHSQQNIWQLLSQFVTQWILQTPINASCSFASYMNISQSQRTFTLVLSSHYQQSNKNKLPTVANILQGVIQVQSLLFDQTYKKVQQNPLKASMVIFNKFQPAAQPLSNSGERTDFTLLRQLTPPDNSLNQSMLSQVSNQSHHTSRKSISGNNANSTSSMKHIAKLQNKIYQILKILDNKKKIYGPVQIQNIIRNYVRWIKKTQKNDGVPQAQYQVIRAFNCINQEIQAEQMYLILKNNMTESNIILSYFLQKSKYSRAIAVGKKIANSSLQNLYKNCLKNGLINSRGTIIPFYLKKLVQSYSTCPNSGPKPLKIQQISIPQLVEILQKKSYDTHLYSSLLTIIFPQLFIGEQIQPALKVVAPLLSYFVQYLIKFDHHPELVFTFIADLLYEVCYFTTDTKLTMLSNSVYMQDRYAKNLTIKQKKVLQMIREGGLKGFGFEFKSMIMPIIQANKLYNYPEQLLYRIVRINKPLELLHLFKILSSCHYTAIVNKISKFLTSKNNFASTLQKSTAPLVCYLLLKTYKSVEHKLPDERQMQRASQVQFQSITDRILRSESGIFQDIVKLNPNVKIAGVQLRTAIKNLSNSRIGAKSTVIQEKKLIGRIDQEEAVTNYMPNTFHKDYQYVSLALSLKQRYLSYHTLSQMQKSYFKDCATNVVDHKKQIIDYLAISQLATQLQSQTK